jgi:hypothetical protein
MPHMKANRKPRRRDVASQIVDILEGHLAKFSPEEQERKIRAFNEAARKARASRLEKAQARGETRLSPPAHQARELHQ